MTYTTTVRFPVTTQEAIPAYDGNTWTVLLNGVEHHARIEGADGTPTNRFWVRLRVPINTNPYGA